MYDLTVKYRIDPVEMDIDMGMEMEMDMKSHLPRKIAKNTLPVDYNALLTKGS